jgi:hypothetical protein
MFAGIQSILALVFVITATYAPSDNADEAAPPAPEGLAGSQSQLARRNIHIENAAYRIISGTRQHTLL